MLVLIVFFSIVVICVHVFDVENNYPNVHSVDRISYVLYVYLKHKIDGRQRQKKWKYCVHILLRVFFLKLSLTTIQFEGHVFVLPVCFLRFFFIRVC